MNKKNKIALVIPLMFSAFVYASYNVYIPSKENSEYIEKNAWGLWYDNGSEYDCTVGTPLESEISNGISFEQSYECTQEVKRDRIDGTNSESYTKTVDKTREVSGTYVGYSCLDILNHQGNEGNGYYTISSGDSVYCDMETNGGGYQLKSTKEYIPDGNLTDGTGVDYESGSNPVNTLVNVATPVGNYAIQQKATDPTWGDKSEYEIHPNVCDYKKDDYIALTIWQNKPYSTTDLFHNRFWYSDGTDSSTGGYHSLSLSSVGLIDQKVVSGVTWYKYRIFTKALGDAKVVADPKISTNTCFSWYVGYSSGDFNPVLFTGMSFKIFTKK